MAFPAFRVYIDVDANALDEATTWQEITSYVEGFTCEHGRSSLLDEFQPGSGAATLRNADGRFDPVNAAGPYYPDLRPRNRIKVEGSFDESLVNQTWAAAAGWTTFGSGGVTISAGALNIVSATTVDDRGAYLDLDRFDDLTVVAAFTITAIPWPSPAVFYPLYLRLTDDGANAVYFAASGGNISAVVFVDGAGTGVWTAAYSAVTHASVRIRRQGTTVLFDTYNGSTWTNRAEAEVALVTAALPRLYHRVETSDTSASTDTMAVGTTTVARQATHPVAYGWVDGWPVSQPHRFNSTVRVTWHDALSVLSRVRPPDSVWDYQIRSHGPSNVWAWWKMGSETNVEVDATGNGRDGRYVVYQNNAEPFLVGHSAEAWALPNSIASDSLVDDLIPSAGRPGRSWAKMQTEVGQPLGGATGKYPRTPSLISPSFGPGLIADRTFAFECWGIFRQAFPLDVAGGAAVLTPMYQPLFTVGIPGAIPWVEFGVKGDGQPYAGAYNVSWGDLTFDNVLTDGQPHHLFFRAVNASGNLNVRCYVDGVEALVSGVPGGVDLGTVGLPSGGYYVVVGHGLQDPDDRGLQSVIGDCVVYDAIVGSAVIAENYAAGAIGSLSGSELTTGEAVDQVLDMIGWGLATDIAPGVKEVSAGPMVDRNALDVMREFAASERAPLYQEPDGTVTMLPRYWQVELGRAKTPAWELGGDTAPRLGYEGLELSFDDRSIINHAEVEYAEGTQVVENAASVVRYGRLDTSTGTRLTAADDALAVAQWLANAYGEPRRRVDRPLVVVPTTDVDYSMALGLRFGARISLVQTTPDGRTVDDDYWVQGVRHAVDPGEGTWEARLTLERADDPYRIFTLAGPGSAPGSELDGPDVLGF